MIGRVGERGDRCGPLVRVVDHEEGTQWVSRADPARRRRARTGVDPGRKVGVPAIFDQRDQRIDVGEQFVVTGDRGQLTGVPDREGVKAHGGGTERPIGEWTTGRTELERRKQIDLMSTPHVEIEAGARAVVIPTGRVVTAGLPRVHHGDQTRLRVASPVTHQEPEASVGPLREFVGHVDPPAAEFGDRVAVHRRLGDRGAPYPSPEVGWHLRVELVAHVGNEAGAVLEFEDAPELGHRPVRPVEVGPDQGVETGIPEPQPGVHHRVRCGVAVVDPGVVHQASDRRRDRLDRGVARRIGHGG